MRNTGCALVILSLVAIAGCGKKVAPSPPPPVAPEAPPPAPQPPRASDERPAVDEYARLRSMSAEELDRLNLAHEIYFDFDRSDVRDDARPVLARNADVLRKFDFLGITVEGHCDERGTVEYNLALGERRAKATFDYLVSLGVPADRLRTASFGKEAPQCSESTEACWARNRRAKLRVTSNTAN